MKFNQIQKAFTLIELIVTIALIGIISLAVGTFFGFNLNTYSNSKDLAAVQFDVRMASDFVTSELRNINEIDLRNVSDALLIAGGNSLSTTILASKYPSVTSVIFNLTKESNRYMVNYTISGNSTKGNSAYSIASKVMINNSSTLNVRTIANMNSDFPLLDYKK